MRSVTLTLVAIAFLAYGVFFGAKGGVSAVLFFIPLTMLPYVVTGVLAWRWKTVAGQVSLIVVALAYGAWFVYALISGLRWDPQSGVMLLFLGLYAAPVLVVLWLGGYGLELWRRKATPSG